VIAAIILSPDFHILLLVDCIFILISTHPILLYYTNDGMNSVGAVNEFSATVSLENTFISVSEATNSVEICVVFRGLGIAQNNIIINIFTRDGSAIG